MHRIKGIKTVFYDLVVRTLFAVVQPDGDQCEAGDTLLHEEEFLPEKCNRDRKSAEHFPINIEKTDSLCRVAPPFFRAEEVEYQYH